MHVHRLGGATPAPLAHYLKALGILRILATQRDPSARGWWKDEAFHLATSLDEEALVAFWMRDYAPSPITSPWNKGSGFLTKGDAAALGLDAIARGAAARLGPLRRGIAEARAMIAELSEADAAVRKIKDEAKAKGLSKAAKDKLRSDPSFKRRLAEAERRFKALKENQIPAFRMRWRGDQLRWMSAAVVLPDGDDKPAYPSLLGTGGNDGRLDFTKNLYDRLGALFDFETGEPRDATRDFVRAGLFGEPTRALVGDAPTGQFLPGTAGGANSSTAPMGGSFVNPFDFVLALEGALLFTAHVSKRLEANTRASAAAPFAVRSAASGYGSAALSDEGPRGEQWMPLWGQPSSLDEVEKLFAEGRSRFGDGPAREPLEFARAVRRLGTARGVQSFQRFAFIERNGQSNLAVPIGRFYASRERVDDAADRSRLVDDLDRENGWLGRVRREARADHAPARLSAAERRLSDALFGVIVHPDEATRWQRALVALGEVEQVMGSGSGFRAGPVPPLDPEWIAAADRADATHVRLAAVFALQGRSIAGPDSGARGFGDGIRRHAIPLEDGRRARFATVGDATSARLAKRSDVVLLARRGVDDAIALVERRLVEAAQRGERHLPLSPAREGARPADLAAITEGRIDLDQVLGLARGMMAIDLRRAKAPGPFAPSSRQNRLWTVCPTTRGSPSASRRSPGGSRRAAIPERIRRSSGDSQPGTSTVPSSSRDVASAR